MSGAPSPRRRGPAGGPAGTVTVGDQRLDYAWVGDPGPAAHHAVFLHEGLGSLDLWRSFPAAVTGASAGWAGLAYSRHGHGRSSVLTGPRRPDYMHVEAVVALPAVRRALGVRRPALVGHSDGASIALIHAADGRWPVAGLVLLAPHVFVEERSLEGIRAARRDYLDTDLARRMSRHHADADATFWGWNDVWLSEGFRDWNIEGLLPRVPCPVLVIQGADDEYGTDAQVDAVARQVAGPVETLVLDGCGHAPHLERPDETLAAVTGFLRRLAG